MMSVAQQVANIQPRIEISDLVGSVQVDELEEFRPHVELDWMPTPEEEREAHEIMAAMTLDSFSPREATFHEFLVEQARQHRLRENHPWHRWLADQIDRIAGRVAFTEARSPEQHEERCEVLDHDAAGSVALAEIRGVASFLAGEYPQSGDHLMSAAKQLARSLARVR